MPMPKFSVVWTNDGSYDPNKQGKIQFNNVTLCKIETWGFHSCACFHLHSFSMGGMHLDMEKFWEFVLNPDQLAYYPKEVYFLLSTTQRDKYGFLWNVPHLKSVARFTNKAHDPNDVFLYLYSRAGDFGGLQ